MEKNKNPRLGNNRRGSLFSAQKSSIELEPAQRENQSSANRHPG